MSCVAWFWPAWPGVRGGKRNHVPPANIRNMVPDVKGSASAPAGARAREPRGRWNVSGPCQGAPLRRPGMCTPEMTLFARWIAAKVAPVSGNANAGPASASHGPHAPAVTGPGESPQRAREDNEQQGNLPGLAPCPATGSDPADQSVREVPASLNGRAATSSRRWLGVRRVFFLGRAHPRSPDFSAAPERGQVANGPVATPRGPLAIARRELLLKTYTSL